MSSSRSSTTKGVVEEVEEVVEAKEEDEIVEMEDDEEDELELDEIELRIGSKRTEGGSCGVGKLRNAASVKLVLFGLNGGKVIWGNSDKRNFVGIDRCCLPSISLWGVVSGFANCVGNKSIISNGSKSRIAVGVVCAIDISLLMDGDSRVGGEEIETKRDVIGGWAPITGVEINDPELEINEPVGEELPEEREGKVTAGFCADVGEFALFKGPSFILNSRFLSSEWEWEWGELGTGGSWKTSNLEKLSKNAVKVLLLRNRRQLSVRITWKISIWASSKRSGSAWPFESDSRIS